MSLVNDFESFITTQQPQAKQPVSPSMGDRCDSYDRIEPFSTVMGLVVDSMNALKTGRMRGESLGVGSIFKIIGQYFLDITFILKCKTKF